MDQPYTTLKLHEADDGILTWGDRQELFCRQLYPCQGCGEHRVIDDVDVMREGSLRARFDENGEIVEAQISGSLHNLCWRCIEYVRKSLEAKPDEPFPPPRRHYNSRRHYRCRK